MSHIARIDSFNGPNLAFYLFISPHWGMSRNKNPIQRPNALHKVIRDGFRRIHRRFYRCVQRR